MIKSRLHPRNRHQGRYDFTELVKSCPALRQHLIANPRGDSSIDFTDSKSVLVLNRAILAHFYGVVDWDIPSGYLCPPIPGRADYIHHIADMMPKGGVQARIGYWDRRELRVSVDRKPRIRVEFCRNGHRSRGIEVGRRNSEWQQNLRGSG